MLLVYSTAPVGMAKHFSNIYIYIERERHRQTDRQTDRDRDRETGRKSGKRYRREGEGRATDKKKKEYGASFHKGRQSKSIAMD